MTMFPEAAVPADREPDGRLAVDRALAPVRRLFRWLGVGLLAAMLALPALQVLLREVIRQPFIGAEELTRFMLICVVFITFPYVVSSGANIRMEELLQALPARLRRRLHVLIAASGTAVLSTAAVSVAVATLRNLNNATPTLGIPYWIFFGAAFLGLLFAAVECAVQLYKALRRRPLYVTFAEEQPPEPPPNL
jgi:TRAP-type C4-dicarboxylate transport system permease small subunit